MHITTNSVFYTTILLAFSQKTLADPSDWVNIRYVTQNRDASTSEARYRIIKKASSVAKDGPWSIPDNGGINAPSGNPRDYLSWAPYHWPNCNWCNDPGRTHLAHTGSGNSTDDIHDPDEPPDGSNSDYEGDNDQDDSDLQRRFSLYVPPSHKRMTRLRRSLSSSLDAQSLAQALPTLATGDDPQAPFGEPLPTTQIPDIPIFSSHTSERAAGTPAPAQNAAKTRKASCTPSPTTSMPPSATWTTCNYIGRDGKVNPDTRRLRNPGALNKAGQSSLNNGLAYSFTRDTAYSQTLIDTVYALLLDPSTAMNPNANYGQVVRGPEPDGSRGSFTGILDMRGLVKIVNAVGILKATGCSAWTQTMDQAFMSWFAKWGDWLMKSPLGRSASNRPNNHGTFYTYQLAGSLLVQRNVQGVRDEIIRYYNGPFREQISASGEQPFEAVRTRPFHYRCFNLEAMIAVAKIGDQVGLDFWGARTKYGATIQTAVDYTMKIDPKRENVQELLPHVAAVAAAYGDPSGKYAAFIQRNSPNYASKPWYYYNQPSAVRSGAWRREVQRRQDAADVEVPFECPEIFKEEKEVELDIGVFVLLR
ncbi:hypothetical protein VNI00_001452 [Paramarasmius palmivorus]|uniref:Alginate lyase domain-containing protein n=1 Tax=Paramarasmius palmivorus TaxID=297713 RepID=A0AAW0E0Q1_9AGAR